MIVRVNIPRPKSNRTHHFCQSVRLSPIYILCTLAELWLESGQTEVLSTRPAGRGGACRVNPLSRHPVATDSMCKNSIILAIDADAFHRQTEHHADSQLPTTVRQLHLPSQLRLLQSSCNLQGGWSFFVWGA